MRRRNGRAIRARAKWCAIVTLAVLCGTGLSRAAGEPSRKLPEHIPLRRSSQTQDAPGGVNTSLPRPPYLSWTERWWTRMFDAGMKYVRIGQYEDTSDMTGWDWVEHEKGHLRLKPEVDAYVDSLVENKTIIELQLLYGNPIYTSPAGILPRSITPTPASVHNRDLGCTPSSGRRRHRSRLRHSCDTRRGW
jgi:hypothetical protein